MLLMVLHALGGLGLFLVGLLILTDGLRRLAGESVHRVLARFTRTPASGALTGAVMTAVLQSSSVTTVATVGFVSAGVLTFPQALGILFGANLGTTITGWLVALLGFELDFERLVPPLLIGGVLMHLFGGRRAAQAGWALAGLMVIFLGLDAMQSAMAEAEGAVTPDDFPDDTLLGRLWLIGIGMLVTLVTQSSSAGVAAALTAVDGGAISFAQAAAMVIGMDVGTTFKTALATIGGSAATRRTGWAHVVYNLLTAVWAVLLLTPYSAALDQWLPGGAVAHAPLALVGFHTAFNALGVLAVLPFTGAFARLMRRLVPDPDGRPDTAERLDPKLLADPTAATLLLASVVRELASDLFGTVASALAPRRRAVLSARQLDSLEQSITAARRFASRIDLVDPLPDTRSTLLGALHVIDHLERLVARARHSERVEAARSDPRLAPFVIELRTACERAAATLEAGSPIGEQELLAVRDRLKAERRPYRDHVLASVPLPEVSLDDAIAQLDAIRWLHRSAYHAWRIAHHLRGTTEPDQPSSGTPAV